MFRRTTPIEELFDVSREFDDLRRAFLAELGPAPALLPSPRRLPATGSAPAFRGRFLPAVECFTRDRSLILKAELPGIDPNDVELSVTGSQLVLRGEKKEEHKVEEEDVHFREISRGRFERSFTLPEGVRTDQIRARFANGVLEVTLPAEPIPAERKVTIEVSDPGKKPVKAA